jgi:hypothetical protein
MLFFTYSCFRGWPTCLPTYSTYPTGDFAFIKSQSVLNLNIIFK